MSILKNGVVVIFIIGAMSISIGCQNYNVENKNDDLEKEIKEERTVEDLIKGKVTAMHDGDSILVEYAIDNEMYENELYLSDIDAPELMHPLYKEQPFAKEAKANLEILTPIGSEVFIEFDKKSKSKVSANNSYIYILDDKENLVSVNNAQVLSGFARVTGDGSIKLNNDEILKSEKIAKEKKLNIWSVGGLVTDEGYDKKYKK